MVLGGRLVIPALHPAVALLAVVGLITAGCSEAGEVEIDAAPDAAPAVAPEAAAKAPSKSPVAIPEEVPKPRGIKILTKEEAGTPPQFVAKSVTRKSILREVLPYLEYIAAREGHTEGVVYLFDRTEEEAGVPLDPVKYFRFFLGTVELKHGKGTFVENADYFKDDEDPSPNGDEIELGYEITKWRSEKGMTEHGTEQAAARAFARKRGMDEDGTWRIYARVLDDSVSLGKGHFLGQAKAKAGGSK